MNDIRRVSQVSQKDAERQRHDFWWYVAILFFGGIFIGDAAFHLIIG